MSLLGLHHVHLRVPDLAASRAFLADFGLAEAAERNGRVYLRGCGPAAYLVVLEQAETPSLGALAFEVDGRGDLERAAKLDGASPIFELDGLCGGLAVSLTDPEGNHVQLVHGIEKQQPAELRPGLVLNFGHDKQRRGASQNVAPLGPAQIIRLGHVGMFVRNAKTCGEWYGRNLGLLPSDLMYAGVPDNVVAGFYRVDRGEEWVDHHSLALFGMGKTDVHHVSFEVQDSEVQFMAHRWMARHGHDSVWGVGRHPKGSHIFDVWRDPSGYRFETFSDTDLCTADRPADIFPIEQAEMDMWSDRNFEAYFA
jgi:catechol 2,3-dioxygenase-like lactoylglutathione lyase family enzyme